MVISVMSECDSRTFVYPFLKCLNSFGSVALFTSNKLASRLIEGDIIGGFQNIRVVMVEQGDLEAAYALDGYTPDKYDFTILDNLGVNGADIIVALVTNRLSDDYLNDLTFIIDEPNCYVVKLGKPAPKKKQEKVKDSSKKKSFKKDQIKEEEEVTEKENQESFLDVKKDTKKPEDYEGDFSNNKWVVEKTPEDTLRDKLMLKDAKWIKFTSLDDFEQMEGRHIFPKVNEDFIKESYRIIGQHLAVDERNYKKGVSIADEISGYVSGTDVR